VGSSPIQATSANRGLQATEITIRIPTIKKLCHMEGYGAGVFSGASIGTPLVCWKESPGRGTKRGVLATRPWERPSWFRLSPLTVCPILHLERNRGITKSRIASIGRTLGTHWCGGEHPPELRTNFHSTTIEVRRGSFLRSPKSAQRNGVAVWRGCRQRPRSTRIAFLSNARD